jgi:hypothetical protein
MADHARARFNEEPVEARDTQDLERANEKLEDDDIKSDDDRTDIGNEPAVGANGTNSSNLEKLGTYDKYEITEDDCYDELGYSFPSWKKWYILTIIFIVQVSMNFNTSLYSNALGGISEQFHVSEQAARVGAAIFLITYAFGCELWAPWYA